MACGNIIASLDYLKRLDLYKTEKPFQLFIPINTVGDDARQTNLAFESQPQLITDMRPNVHDFKLDSHGFEVRVFPTTLQLADFQQRHVVESQYLAHVEQLLKTIEGGFDRIFFFDWRVSIYFRQQSSDFCLKLKIFAPDSKFAVVRKPGRN